MITTKIELTKLTASEGMTLYNGKEMGKVIYLGASDSADNWREITDEEAAQIRKEEEEKNRPEGISV